MVDDPATFDALRTWAAPKLRSGVPFVDGVPLLPLDEAIDRIAAELPQLGGPALSSPPLELLAGTVTRIAVRLRRAGRAEPRAALLDMLADELLDAGQELEAGEHARAVDLVRRVCVMVLYLDEIAGRSATTVPGTPAGRGGQVPVTVRPGRPRLRALEQGAPPLATIFSTSTPGPPAPDIPWAGPRLADTVLGAHLRHLRQCQELSLDQIAARMPATARMDAGTIADLEAGTGTLLREAARRGHLSAYLHAYGAGALAAADFQQLLADVELAKPGYATDRGPGRTHRYQILEQSADIVLLLGHVLVPAALRTPAYEMAASLDTPVVRVTGGIPAPGVVPVAAAGCPVCRIYRADQLVHPDAPGVWQLGVNTERAAAFEERLRSPGTPETTVIIAWDVLDRRFGGAGVHAEQMLHLADLARNTTLRVRVLANNDGYIAQHELAVLRVGEQAVTASWGLADVTYQDRVHVRAEMALERALPPETSIELLDRAAAGSLPRRGLL